MCATVDSQCLEYLGYITLILGQNLDLNMSAIIGNYFVLINGPSAGCTFVTVFISFALQKQVNRNLGAKYLIFVFYNSVKLR